MCLIVKEGCKIEVAKRDITTCKKVRIINDYYWSAIFYGGRFRFNKSEKTVTNLSIENRQINEGFHSFKRPDDIYVICGELVICIIPKGSEYCLGDSGDIVSNQIIVFKTVFDYIKYKLWRLFH